VKHDGDKVTAAAFVKPVRVEVDIAEALRAVFGDEPVLVKDIQEMERICTRCQGLGVVRRSNVYGLRDEPIGANAFPYDRQDICWCPHCYYGVQKICEHCQLARPKGRECACAAAEQERRAQRQRAEEAKLRQLPRVPLAQYDGEMLYHSGGARYVLTEEAESGEYFATHKCEDWLKPDAEAVIERIEEESQVDVEDGEEFVHFAEDAAPMLEWLLEEWFKAYVRLDATYWVDNSRIVVVPEGVEQDE